MSLFGGVFRRCEGCQCLMVTAIGGVFEVQDGYVLGLDMCQM